MEERPFEQELDATEENGVWTVFNVFERSGATEDGQVWMIMDGGIYVDIQKSNGEVLEIRMDG